jgi:GT2 family glycosyltransferase
MIEGVIAGGRPPGEVAIVLDNMIQAVLPLEPGPRGTIRFTHKLPRHAVHASLDVLALPGTDSILGMKFDLLPSYQLAMGTVGLDGLFLTGSFTAATFLAAELGVEFLAGNTLVAQGVARRDGGGVPPCWQFRIPIHALLRPHEELPLLPRVAGHRLSGPAITLTPAGIGFLGCLDAASPNHVEGWAASLQDPTRRLRLDVVVDADIVATVTADAHRPDISDLGLGEPACGFHVILPDHPDHSAKRRIAVRLAGERTELAGSPLILDPVPGLIGSFDTLHGMAAHGWALNRAHPEVPLPVEVIGPGGEVLGTGLANLFRGDLLDAELNKGLCAFKIDISAHFDRLMDQDVFARIAGTDQFLPGSPIRVHTNRNIRKLLRRRQDMNPLSLPRLKRALTHRAGADGISFIMPVHNTPRAWLIEALESLRAQFCDAWELICVDDGSTLAHVGEILTGYATRDKRIRVLRSPENVGIARAVNFGLRAARFGYVAVVDHDDKLEPDATWQLIRAARETDADLLYTDEAQTAEHIDAITELRLRPAFSHDYYLSHPYFVHLVCARTEIARRIGGWDETMAISADVDFVLRMIEAARVVTHVPAVLYRWRTHGGSTGHSKQEAVMAATTGALQRHLDRLRTGATVSPGVWFNQFRVDWPAAAGRVLIVIPTRNKVDLLRTAVESIERTSKRADYKLVVIDHESDDLATRAYLEKLAVRNIVMPYAGKFNFSAMNNAAVAAHGDGCDYILFLNNDVEATEEGWLDRMRRLAARPDVGAVGALLMYSDRSVQHAGVILGFNDSAEHALKFQSVFLDEHGRRNLGYNCALTSVRDYSAVTAACLMTRASVFAQVGGFDEAFGIGFNDTDLCLRIGQAGYRILYDGATILYHYESATRSQTKQVFHPEDTTLMITRWGDALRAGDPFYNPNLSLTTQDHVPREGEPCRIMQKPRATVLDLRVLARAAPPKGKRKKEPSFL